MLHETMCLGVSACETLLKLFLGWEGSAIDANGILGGLLILQNSQIVDFKSFHTCAGIIVEGSIKGFDEVLKMINCYAPYKDWQQFWDTVDTSMILIESCLIFAGDLNFTMNSTEYWGNNNRLDPLSKFFHRFFQRKHLLYIVPSKRSPTWKNGGSGATESGCLLVEYDYHFNNEYE